MVFIIDKGRCEVSAAIIDGDWGGGRGTAGQTAAADAQQYVFQRYALWWIKNGGE